LLCYALVLITVGRQGNYSITILAAYLAQIPSVLDELRRNELYGQVDDRDAEALAEEDKLVALNDTSREAVRSSDRVRPNNTLSCIFLTSWRRSPFELLTTIKVPPELSNKSILLIPIQAKKQILSF
jgi:hypothetical protein